MSAGGYYIGGVHALAQAIAQQRLEKLLLAQGKQSKKVAGLLEQAKQAGVAVEEVPLYHLDLLLPNVKHQGVVGQYLPDETGAQNWQQAIAGCEKPLILVLDSVQDPHNLGACLRSALAAGVQAVVMGKNNSADITAVVHRVSCGASEVLPIFRVVNVRRELQAMQQMGIWVVGGAGGQDKTIYEVNLNTPLALVVGNEGEGLRHGIAEQCDYLLTIPLDARMESLNVSVACGILLFEARRQRLLG